MTPRLDAQMAFLTEACKLKQVDRQSALQDLSRPENSAEHSWHVALYALIMDIPELARAEDRIDAIKMILLHDLVEIDAGDHPIHLDHDADAVALAEAAAADRLFGLLPADQSTEMRALWDQFEAAVTSAARGAKRMDHVQPMLQATNPAAPLPDHIEVVEDNLAKGRAKDLHQDWPAMFAQVRARLDGTAPPEGDLSQQLDFLNECDRLKPVYRATRIAGGSRFENSAEHSWHLALYALILAEHAPHAINLDRVITMLLLHDLVEIDAGDAPIFGDYDVAAKEAEELEAARKIFGRLPATQGAEMLAIWQEFEANESPDAVFAKSLDRFQAPNQNLASSGGSWVDYNVTYEMFLEKVGHKIAHGAPALQDWVAPRVKAFLTTLQPNP
ncbi:MAG: HD domain-containing protein [Pseudomonadota bacterium]|nr:HD domain-containing protein [Pseudomonadota bacterium]